MNGVIFILILALVMLICGLFLFQGKGSWLIAGYNTSSEEEKSKYDKMKLCKSMGIFCAGLSIMLCIVAFFCFLVETGRMLEQDLLPVAWIFLTLLISGVIAEMIYTNKYCKKKNT